MTLNTSNNDIILLLDSSCSMKRMGEGPIHAVNNFIKDQRMVNPNRRFSLYKFDSDVHLVYDDVPLYQVPELKEYTTGTLTALYDALGTAIVRKTQSSNCHNVTCVVITDGMENVSKQFKKYNIKYMIQEMQNKYNWTFIYLGVDKNTPKVAAAIGIDCCGMYDPTPCGFVDAMDEITNVIACMNI